MEHYCLLSSGVTLGTYVPAVMLEKQMTSKGLKVDTYVLETYFQQGAQGKLIELKKQIHQSFAFAKMAQKVSSDIKSSYDETKLQQLFETWQAFDTIHLIVFSGFWISIIDEFVGAYSHQVEIDVQVIHMDASYSASWKLHKQLSPDYQHNWLFNLEAMEVTHSIGIPQEIIPFTERKSEVLIHGGGWGIGTYQNTLQSSIADHYHLNMVAYEPSDMLSNVSISYFQQQPGWNAWNRDEHGNHTFPPMIVKSPGSEPTVEYEFNGCSPIYRIVQLSQAIISKPGGATIMDSLHSATPLIYLENYGKYETDNAELWRSLGLGMSFPEWKASGFDPGLLEQMHHNLTEVKSNTQEVIDLLTQVVI
ncbi:MAG: hypothetical protein R8G66_03005 [Cytophagales bacterium]|nr:hypothetical protein [Cytophagales bacterium]